MSTLIIHWINMQVDKRDSSAPICSAAAHIHKYVFVYTHKFFFVYIHKYVFVYIHKCVFVYIHKFVFVYMSLFLENCTGSAQFVQWYVFSKHQENRNNWHNKQVYHILKQDYHTYTSYIINCNCHKILSINGYAVFVIRSYLLIFFTFFMYLTQMDLLKNKFANIWKIRRKLKDLIW